MTELTSGATSVFGNRYRVKRARSRIEAAQWDPARNLEHDRLAATKLM